MRGGALHRSVPAPDAHREAVWTLAADENAVAVTVPVPWSPRRYPVGCGSGQRRDLVTVDLHGLVPKLGHSPAPSPLVAGVGLHIQQQPQIMAHPSASPEGTPTPNRRIAQQLMKTATAATVTGVHRNHGFVSCAVGVGVDSRNAPEGRRYWLA